MAYTEVTTQSYGSKIGSSLKGILGGILLLIIGTVVLFWNEGRAVKTEDMIREVEKAVVVIPDISKVDPELQGKVTFGQGEAVSLDSLSDPLFQYTNVLTRYERQVEYYQYVEREETKETKNTGGSTTKTTTYHYDKRWVKSPVNSANFKDPKFRNENYVLFRLEDLNLQAKNVSFGAYKLPDLLINMISAPESPAIDFTPELKDKLENLVTDRGNNTTSVIAEERGGSYYVVQDAKLETIGDVRITLTQTPAKNVVSFIAQQEKDTFVSYVSKGDSDYTYAELLMGTHSKEQVIQKSRDDNKMLTWLLRALGLILLFVGFSAIFKVGEAVADILPFLGNLVAFGSKVIAFILSLIWGLFVIALGWLFYRPLLSLALFVVIGVLIYFVVSKRKKMKAAAVAESSASSRKVYEEPERNDEENYDAEDERDSEDRRL